MVYKAGHHGAKSSNSERFLRAVQPQYVIISAGEGNNYGHPHPEMLDRAADIGAAVLRTDELGTIEVITDGEQMWWSATADTN
jgi:competence protein ComEC